jgi:hypothetical protein
MFPYAKEVLNAGVSSLILRKSGAGAMLAPEVGQHVI